MSLAIIKFNYSIRSGRQILMSIYMSEMCSGDIFEKKFNLLTLLPVYLVLNFFISPQFGYYYRQKNVFGHLLCRWCLVCTQMERLIDLEQSHTVNETLNNKNNKTNGCSSDSKSRDSFTFSHSTRTLSDDSPLAIHADRVIY